MNYFQPMEITDLFGQSMESTGLSDMPISKISIFCNYCIILFLRFVPKERWLHNIEHGAVVMLYDPCTLESEVNKLKRIVRSCIKKHIITPTTFLSPERVIDLIFFHIQDFYIISFFEFFSAHGTHCLGMSIGVLCGE